MSTSGIIVASVVITAGTTFVAQASTGKWHFQSYLAASFVGILLAGLAMINEQLARNFALLIILVALLRNGTQTVKYLQSTTLKHKGA